MVDGSSAAELVAPALAELANMTIGPASATLSLFESAAQDHLTRQDEIAVLIDAVRKKTAAVARRRWSASTSCMSALLWRKEGGY